MNNSDQLRFDGKVAIVTGAGGGLGRTYALLFASRGAKVVVNDLGGKASGEGQDQRAADIVVDEIKKAGGIAVPNYNSVEDGEAIVRTALENFGKIDILVNNAGILRDRSFVRTSDQDWDLVHKVHLRGSFMVTRAAWPHMKKQGFGRIIMTSSVAGIYGNFGQSNYSAAKLGLVGFSNTLAIEGRKYNISCNAVAPMGGTRLTQGIIPPDLFEQLKPELVAPLVAWLCHEDCDESGSLFEAGAGWYGKYRWARSKGKVCRSRLSEQVSPEAVRDNWHEITSFDETVYLDSNETAAGKLVEALDEIRTQESSQTTSGTGASTDTEGPLSAVGLTRRTEVKWDFKDVILYALGVTVSTKEENGLKFLFELHESFSPLPTFSIVPLGQAVFGSDSIFRRISGWDIDFTKVLHGEQYIEVLSPLPTEGTGYAEVKITDVLDKGSGAVILVEASLHDNDDKCLVKSQWSVFVVGDGGFGGPRSSDNIIPLQEPPSREPDAILKASTSIDQASIYRLSGDFNPLHIDPSFAAMGGFKEPILHGLCSYGIVGKCIVNTFCGGNVEHFKSIKARFANPVVPGDTLAISVWQDDCRIFFEAKSQATGKVCLSGGYVDLYEKPTRTIQTEENLLDGVDKAMKELANVMNKNVADKIKEVYQWNITDRKGNVRLIYTFDFQAPSSVYKGKSNKKVTATLTCTHEVFLDILRGNLTTQKMMSDDLLQIEGMIVSFHLLMSPFFPQSKM